MQAKQAATVVAVSLALPIVLTARAEAAPYLHLSNSAPSKLALRSVPHSYLKWYRQAARTCRGLPWPVLAGIGEMESDHGQSTAPGVHSASNFAGAEGPMQFEPGTFAAFAVDADRSRALSPYDPQDAIFTAAHMLCAEGARGGSPSGIMSALFAYNPADWYPPDVMSWATRYATRGTVHRIALRRVRAPHVPAAPRVPAAPHIPAAPHVTDRPHVTAVPPAGPPSAQTVQPVLSVPIQPPRAASAPGASRPVPAPPATRLEPAPPATTPGAQQPAVSQPTAPQLSAEATRLAAEAQRLSAEAWQLSAEARQLSAEARQLSADAQRMSA